MVYMVGSNSITYMPSFSFLKQGEFSQLTVSNNVNLGKFLFGAGFRFVEGYSYRDALIFSFGVDTGDLVFHYSGTGGAHEISTIIRVNNKVKNNKVSVPSCSFQ
jgi:hypothetical protein